VNETYLIVPPCAECEHLRAEVKALHEVEHVELAHLRAEVAELRRENTRIALGQPAVEANIKLREEIDVVRSELDAARRERDRYLERLDRIIKAWSSEANLP